MEKQRRAKLRATSAPGKVYTDGDRSGNAAPAPADGTATPDAASAATSKKTKEKTSDELGAEKQKEWADRLKKAQDEITSLQAVIAKNERSLNSTFNITPARADLATQVEADKKKLTELQQSLVNLEDERRRAGLPRR